MDSLPEELQLYIFEFLDSAPPSAIKARQEPSLNLTSSSRHVLKDISYVSKRWRRISLPLLYKHAFFRLDRPPRPEWGECKACGKFRGKVECERYHVEMVQAMNQFASNLRVPSSMTNAVSFSPSDDVAYRSYEFSTAIWANRMYHALDDFLRFIQSKGLTSAVRSFVLVSDRMLSGKSGRFPHESGQGEWRYPASAAFWHHLLSVISPGRIAAVAPPTELACLMNASIDTFGVSRDAFSGSVFEELTQLLNQDWAFTDMDYHILEFKIDRNVRYRKLTRDFGHHDLVPVPSVHPGFADSCLLNLLPWTHISLNEGSFLKAYGTYEFFERGPPSLVYSIGRALTSRNRWKHWQDIGFSEEAYQCSLRSFTYTGIFPFSNHADFRVIIPYLEELDVQFAPDPQSGILDDKQRTGKAELQDCWQELVSAYHDIVATIGTFRMSMLHFPKLKKFVCRDSRIPALQEELDEIFTPLCMPVWAEFDPGVFLRQATSPAYAEDESFPEVIEE